MIRLFLLIFFLGLLGMIVFAPDKKNRDNIIFELYRNSGAPLNISS